MKTLFQVILFTVVATAFSSPIFAEESETTKKSITVAGSPVKEAYSVDRPDYLHFKEVTLTREGTQRLKFDITLQGKMPASLKNEVSFYIGFDIDCDPSTGGVDLNHRGFGQDIGIFIVHKQNDTRFHASSNTVEYKGRKREITISGLKVSGDKMEVELRSELFSQFDTFKFFLSVSQIHFEQGKQISDTQVHTTPITKF